MLSWLPSPAAPAPALLPEPAERSGLGAIAPEPAERSPQRTEGEVQNDPQASEPPCAAPRAQGPPATHVSASSPRKLDLRGGPPRKDQRTRQEDAEGRAPVNPGAKLPPDRNEALQLEPGGPNPPTPDGDRQAGEAPGGAADAPPPAPRRCGQVAQASSTVLAARASAWDLEVPRERRGSRTAAELRRLLHEELSDSGGEDTSRGSRSHGGFPRPGLPRPARSPGEARFGAVEDDGVGSPLLRARGRSFGTAEGGVCDRTLVNIPNSPLPRVSNGLSSPDADLLSGEPSERLRSVRRSFFDRLDRNFCGLPHDSVRHPLEDFASKRGSRLKALPCWMGDLSDDCGQSAD